MDRDRMRRWVGEQGDRWVGEKAYMLQTELAILSFGDDFITNKAEAWSLLELACAARKVMEKNSHSGSLLLQLHIVFLFNHPYYCEMGKHFFLLRWN